jgi:Tfp pilus assembly protein PilF
VQNDLGLTCFDLEEYEDSLKHFSNAIEKETIPDFVALYHNNKGLALYQQYSEKDKALYKQNLGLAIDEFNAAIKVLKEQN